MNFRFHVFSQSIKENRRRQTGKALLLAAQVSSLLLRFPNGFVLATTAPLFGTNITYGSPNGVPDRAPSMISITFYLSEQGRVFCVVYCNVPFLIFLVSLQIDIDEGTEGTWGTSPPPRFCNKQRTALFSFRNCPLFLRKNVPSKCRAPPSLRCFLRPCK